jgi:peptide-methionine (S)-S-oxide reductase
LKEAMNFISERVDRDKIVVEVLPLMNYIKSADEHQDRLDKYPNDYCHIPKKLLQKYL